MSSSNFISRMIALMMVFVLLLNEGGILTAYAIDTVSTSDSQVDEHIDLSPEDISGLLSGESDLDVSFTPEAEAALTQTMEALSRLMESGQVEYNEETGMLTLMDPNADLSGLNINGLETVTDGDNSQRIVANIGMPSDEPTGGFTLLSEETSSLEDVPAEGEAADNEEDPATGEETEGGLTGGSEESSGVEDPTVPKEPTEGEELPDGDKPGEGEQLPEDGEPSEDEETAEEGESSEEEESEEGEDLALDEDAELMFFWDKCEHKATKAENVKYFNTYKKGRTKKGEIAKKGTIVEVLDSKRPSLFGDLYYKVKIKNVGTYWVLAGNVKDHACSAPDPVTTVTYKDYSNTKHIKYSKTPAKTCSSCDCPIKDKSNKESKEEHSWSGLGICTAPGCGHNFKEEYDNCKDTVYMVAKDGVKLRKTPYSADTETRTLNKGDNVLVVQTATNAFHSFFSPHIWYLTDAGDWIYSENAEKHAKHSYNAESTKTGLCTVCGRMYGYDIIPMSNTSFEVAVSHDPPIRKKPYSKSDTIIKATAGTIYTMNGYTYSDPNWSFWSSGSRTDKWYRVKGPTWTGWIKYSDVKEHVAHKYTQDSGGTCSYAGCGDEFKLKPKKITATAYETKKSNVVAYKQPYSNSTAQQTYQYKSTIVSIDRTVTNSLNETWLRTTDDMWIRSTDLKLHTHNLKVGVCVSTGCSYISNVNTIQCKKYTGETFVPTQLKEKPFDDAKTVSNLAPNTCVTINGTCTVEGKIWLRTTTGQFVPAGDVKKHRHSYKGGYCAPCKSYEKWTTTVIKPLVVLSKADGTVVREKPYAVAPVIRTLKKDEEIVIVQKCTNSLKRNWYQLVDGNWIYFENIKTQNGAKVTTTNKLTVDNYTITVVDDCGDPLPGATVSWVGQNYTSDENGKVHLAYVTTKTDLTVTLTGYDKISLTEHTMSSSRKETLTMAETGSYKATEVIMNYLGTDINVLRTSKNLNKYHTQGFFQADMKFTIKTGDSVAGKIGKYQLVQGTDVIATSKDGVFTGLDVGDFYAHKTIYLKVFDKNDRERAKQDLRINVFNEGLDGSSPNLSLGLGKLKIAIPVGCPLVGGFEINLDPPSILDVTVEIDDDSTKGSVEVDVGTIAEKFGKTEAPKHDADKNYWTNLGAYKKYWDTIKEMKQSSWQSYFNRKQVASANPKWSWDFAVGGYVEKMHGEDVWNGKLYFCVSAKINKGWQVATPIGIPVVIEVGFKGSGTVGAALTIKSAQVTNFTVPLDLSFAVEASGGVGIRHIGDISFFGQAALGLEFQLYPPEWDETNIFLRGSLGIKARALGAEIFRFSFLESPIIYIVQEGKFVLWDASDPYAALLDAGSYTPIDRSYLYNRSGWYEEGASLMEDVSVSIADLDVEVLQSNTYPDLKPQVVTADDGTIMMLFTDDNANRAEIDRTMLVFSLYDPATGRWTEPQPVWDDGTGDYGFSAHSVGEDIYLVWQNAKSTHASNADITSVSRQLEITVAKYDAFARDFTCIEQLTDNDVYENMPRISAVNGQVVVSWLTNSDHSIFQASGENTVWYAVKTEDAYDTNEAYSPVIEDSMLPDEDMEEQIDPEDLPEDAVYVEPVQTPWNVFSMAPTAHTITSMAVGYMLNDGYVAYTTDADGDTSTVEDQFIHLISTQTGQLMPYTDKACNVEFTQVHGDNAMTWYNQGTIYYALSPAYAPQMLFEDKVDLGNDYQIISDALGNMAILSTRNGESCSNAYIMLYDGETFQWGLPVAVTDQDLYIRDFYGAYHEGTIVSIFNRTALNEATFAESNSLCSAIINDRHDLVISDVDVNTYRLEPLADTPVMLTVTNSGTSRVESFTATLYDSNDNVVCTKNVVHPLRMGESVVVDMNITMGETVEQATYRLAVTVDGLEDDHPENNEHSFLVGEPLLVLEAESTPTEDENIVVLTVTNDGYGELGGSLVLLDDSGKITNVLVEEFAPISHDGKYTCAVLFSEEYFGDESSAVFRFGAIPTGSAAVCCETALYVDKASRAESASITIEDSNLEGAGEDAALMEATEKTVAGIVTNDTEFDLMYAVLCASAYDVNGVWLDSYTETINLPSEEEYAFTAVFLTEADIESVTITILDKETMEPLIAAQHITLTYDVISN